MWRSCWELWKPSPLVNLRPWGRPVGIACSIPLDGERPATDGKLIPVNLKVDAPLLKRGLVAPASYPFFPSPFFLGGSLNVAGRATAGGCSEEQ